MVQFPAASRVSAPVVLAGTAVSGSPLKPEEVYHPSKLPLPPVRAEPSGSGQLSL